MEVQKQNEDAYDTITSCTKFVKMVRLRSMMIWRKMKYHCHLESRRRRRMNNHLKQLRKSKLKQTKMRQISMILVRTMPASSFILQTPPTAKITISEVMLMLMSI